MHYNSIHNIVEALVQSSKKEKLFLMKKWYFLFKKKNHKFMKKSVLFYGYKTVNHRFHLIYSEFRGKAYLS